MHQTDVNASGMTGPDSATEAGLLARLRGRDPAAFEILVRSHIASMLAVARRYVHSEDDAQDVVQEAFTSAFRAMERFEGASRLGTWLHTITVRAALMKLRTRRRKPEQSIEELIPEFDASGHRAHPGRAWSASAEELASRRETRQVVRDAIARLPETYRSVLLLRDIEGMDTREAAQVLEISEPLVKTRLHRARQALRELLDRYLRAEAT
jgi:RNA polymerase sigma-70 factor (ECF subfamily)